MDVKTAFLNAKLEETIYMKLPKGFEKTDDNGNPLVAKLNNALYGLKQAGRNWNVLFTQWLVSEGYKQSETDPCLFISKADPKVIIMVYVVVKRNVK